MMSGRVWVRVSIAALAMVGVLGCNSGSDKADTGTDVGNDTGKGIQCSSGLQACGAKTVGGKTTPDDVCCAADEQCDRTTIVGGSRCTSVCDGGCLSALDTCDPVSKQCLPKKCGATTCGHGQDCVTTAAPTTASSTGDTCGCIPADSSGTTDSCAPFGMVCSVPSYATVPGACRLPHESEPCSLNVGCADSTANCVNVVAIGSPVCINKCDPTSAHPSSTCGSTDKCMDATSALSPELINHCAPNLCQQTFTACPVDTTNDGFCVPHYPDPKDPSSGVGVCLHDQTNPPQLANKTCRVDYAAAAPCAKGEYCVAAKVMPNGEVWGNCQPVCDSSVELALDSCPTRYPGTICVFREAAPDNGNVGELGVCASSCNVLTGSCADSNLGNHNTCILFGPDAANGACLPASVNAVSANQACAPSAMPAPMPCLGSAYCSSAGASATAPVCRKYCDATVCPFGPVSGNMPTPSAACAECNNAPCYPYTEWTTSIGICGG